MARRSRKLRLTFGGVLRELRKKAGISQEVLAHRSDLHRTFISLLECGVRSPTLDSLFALAEVLKIRPHQLVKAAEDRLR